MNDNYPIFQYSFFLAGKDSPQIVVRGKVFEDFILNVEQAIIKFKPVTERGKINPLNQTEPIAEPLNTQVRYCSQCKAVMDYKEGVGKVSNKPYKGFFCSQNCGAKPVFVGTK